MTQFARRFLGSASQAWPWLLLFVLSAVLVSQRGAYSQIIEYPQAWTFPLADGINVVMDWMVQHLQGLTRGISAVLTAVFTSVQTLLVGAPWLVSMSLFTLIAWQGGGWRLALIAVVSLFYVLVSGLWAEAMNTLSLVLVALPMAVLIGFGFGYLGFRSARACRVIMPMLDLMQTIPAFAYLIPILLLFGFGPVVGLIASVVFAVPPMVRNTILGFQRIPPAVLESARMSGCSRPQQFIWAEFPTALPQMLIGVNQTTMAALSMVIIAAIIGGFSDIGWEVLSAMRKAQFGHSLLSGIVIVVLAVLLDRVTASFAARQLPTASHSGLPTPKFALILGIVTIGALGMAYLMPMFWVWGEMWIFFPAQSINQATTSFVLNFGDAMLAMKNGMLFYVLLPIKLGFDRAVVPYTWGIEFTPFFKGGYWALVFAGSSLTFALGRWRIGVAIIALLGFMFFGATGLPWMTVFLAITLVGYQLGGLKLAVFSGGSVVFLLVNGLWLQAMLSVYLCFAAVVICIVLGGLMGIWAASSDTVSKGVRIINDTLQTLPQFVLLIPALMLFQVGDFTALLAIVAYAIVPMIRYTEHGLRSVPVTLIDAGLSSGCSRSQLFWLVSLPQALPQILIGINQTVLYSLGMLVIAALVGTTGLGQAVYVALGRADAGAGLIAGLGMALIAMTIDKILQAVIGLQTDTQMPNP